MIFTPNMIGQEVVTAYDDADPSTSSQCEITILGRKDPVLLIPIREHSFWLEAYHAPGNVAYPGPVNIIKGVKGVGVVGVRVFLVREIGGRSHFIILDVGLKPKPENIVDHSVGDRRRKLEPA
jgi:hypothetical protein